MAGNARTVQVNIVGDSSKLSSAMKKAGDDTTAASGRIMSAWRGVASGLSGVMGGALEPILSSLDGFQSAFEKASDGTKKHVGLMAAGIGAGAAGAGAVLAGLGSKEQAAQQQLAQAFDNVGANLDDFQGRIDKSVGSMTKFGYTSDQVKDSMTQLVTATKDPAKSLDLLRTAANLAALKHEDLGTATEQLVKIVGGKGTRTLAELGIQMGKTGKSGYDVEAALKAVADRTQGQASAASDTFTGKLKAVRAEVENHVAEFGQKYGPAITAAGVGMTALGGATETVSAIMSKFRAGDEAVTAAEGIKTVSEAADTAAEGAEAAGATAADAASLPLMLTVGLIVAAVAALGIGIYELATHWSTVWNGIKDVTVAVWHGIDNDFIHPLEHFFSGVVGFIKKHWDLLLAIMLGPIGIAADLIGRHIDTIVGFFEKLPGRVGGFFEDIGKDIVGAFKEAFNAVADVWNSTVGSLSFHIPSWVPGVGGDGFSMPKIPHLAEGGIVTGPTLAMLGDNRSGTEAVVPLEKAGSMGFGGGAPAGDLVLQIDGNEFARIAWPLIQSKALQTSRRNAVKVGLA